MSFLHFFGRHSDEDEICLICWTSKKANVQKSLSLRSHINEALISQMTSAIRMHKKATWRRLTDYLPIFDSKTARNEKGKFRRRSWESCSVIRLVLFVVFSFFFLPLFLLLRQNDYQHRWLPESKGKGSFCFRKKSFLHTISSSISGNQVDRESNLIRNTRSSSRLTCLISRKNPNVFLSWSSTYYLIAALISPYCT